LLQNSVRCRVRSVSKPARARNVAAKGQEVREKCRAAFD
jgi:hypothetical protein